MPLGCPWAAVNGSEKLKRTGELAAGKIAVVAGACGNYGESWFAARIAAYFCTSAEWTMQQVLFRIPFPGLADGIPIYGFGAMLFLAFIAGTWLAARRA